MANRILNLLLLCCVFGAANAAQAQAPRAAPAFALNVERVDGAGGAGSGKVYRIASSATVAAAPAAVWRILTDYNHMADYVPDLDSARVLSRDGDKVVVEQVGAARFLFFSHAIRLVVQVHEQAPDRLDVSLVEGDMKVYHSSWELHPVAGAAGTRVTYNATLAPNFYVPGMVGKSLVRKDIANMMAAVLARLERDE
jgi:ribosome-associated toxin RatA of RatAB toxin-antitoxin module